MRRLLIVAGSDSGGGAGIQADIKTATAYGVYAATAITAITVQDTLGVHGVHAVPDETIAAQLRVVLDDIGADAVKTGMLASAAVIALVAAGLEKHAPGVPLVVDPVMVAKGGARLIDEGAVAALKDLLIPRATLLTPNAPEAAALLGVAELNSVDDLLIAGRELKAMGASAVLMKGGHIQGETVADVLISDDGEDVFSHARIHTQHTHGTGCTLASAIASGLALGWTLRDAVETARAYVIKAIETAPGFGEGHGPLNHMHGIGRSWT
ncbi:Hydroxymethylpyrimidine/phosphomethylpyrimidine kinase [Alphaproteobacteria bacterium SO-S41]|nr:Hydroxymethylpyrimidine/phosphomethylpyrimidine kinase [Alphaproteobacteria bacterium SO-S41]